MVSILNCCELVGLDGVLVKMECTVNRGKSVFDLVGLPDAAINESRLRVKSGIKQSGLHFPGEKRITVNLAPADQRKEGSGYDMAIGAGLLINTYELEGDYNKILFFGELSLDGSFVPLRGALAAADFAAKAGFEYIFLPPGCAAEASLASGVKIVAVKNIPELFALLNGEQKIMPYICRPMSAVSGQSYLDLADINEQRQSKRCLEIAAAGHHNILMSGPPGSGKTMLAQALPGLMSSLTPTEIIEVSKIYSIAGQLRGDYISQRPFRNPHHSSSYVSLVGGGRFPKPGEVTMAHRGVLFLDEFPEFSRQAIEMLRQPMEGGTVTVSRAEATVTFPARCLLVAAQNPCPCGYFGDPVRSCCCTPLALSRYRRKISGPILDRIDLQVHVPRLSYSELRQGQLQEKSEIVKARVLLAQERQAMRFKIEGKYNSEMSAKEIKLYCKVDDTCERIIAEAMNKYQLSARVISRLLKVGRTIADLEGSDEIKAGHLAEALQYRERST